MKSRASCSFAASLGFNKALLTAVVSFLCYHKARPFSRFVLLQQLALHEKQFWKR